MLEMYHSVSPKIKDELSYIYLDLMIIECVIDASVDIPLEDRNMILQRSEHIQDILKDIVA